MPDPRRGESKVLGSGEWLSTAPPNRWRAEVELKESG